MVQSAPEFIDCKLQNSSEIRTRDHIYVLLTSKNDQTPCVTWRDIPDRKVEIFKSIIHSQIAVRGSIEQSCLKLFPLRPRLETFTNYQGPITRILILLEP